MSGSHIIDATDSEAERLGAALARLRKDRGLTQAEAGARIGMTSQGWGLYEVGRRAGLFRPDIQRRLTGALESSPEDLALMLISAPAPHIPSANTGVQSPGRKYQSGQSLRPARSEPGLQQLQLSNDELSPWATSGVILDYMPGRWPRRDQGCVIDLIDGPRLVRLYESADAENLFLRGGPDGLGRASPLSRDTVAAIGAVVARREHS